MLPVVAATSDLYLRMVCGDVSLPLYVWHLVKRIQVCSDGLDAEESGAPWLNRGTHAATCSSLSDSFRLLNCY
jgi:hypothetical protein